MAQAINLTTGWTAEGTGRKEKTEPDHTGCDSIKKRERNDAHRGEEIHFKHRFNTTVFCVSTIEEKQKNSTGMFK